MKRYASALLMFLWAAFPGYGQVSVTTSRYNNNRDGQNLNETILTPANVNVNGFGKLFSHAVDGYVYAQPLYVPNVTIPNHGTHNVLYVATQHDSVYAFDADDNEGTNASPLWHRVFINPKHGITTVSSGDQGCTDIVPEIGITSTPVISADANTMYVVVRTKENGSYRQRLHALDIATGKERSGSPAVIAGKVKGTGDGSVGGMLAFDPFQQGQRPGLLLQNGAVYIGWASYCDLDPFHSWVMAYDAVNLTQIGIWNGTPDGSRGGTWHGGAGIAGDGSDIYFATGNGTFDANTGGRDYGDSVIKLAPPVNKHMTVLDYFTPYNQAGLANGDRDVGSGGVLLLPDQDKNAPHQHLLIQAGKEGSIYLIDRDHMGHFHAKNNSQIVQALEDAIGGMFSAATWWNNNVYFGGIRDFLRQYTFDPKTGLLSTSAVATSETSFAFPGSEPSLSADGNTNGILWALERTTTKGVTPVILHAYDATNISSELYNSGQNASRDAVGNAVKFAPPIVANGKVYVPAIKQVTVYGLLGGAHKRRLQTKLDAPR